MDLSSESKCDQTDSKPENIDFEKSKQLHHGKNNYASRCDVKPLGHRLNDLGQKCYLVHDAVILLFK